MGNRPDGEFDISDEMIVLWTIIMLVFGMLLGFILRDMIFGGLCT